MPRHNIDPTSRKTIAFVTADGKKVKFSTRCNNERDILCYGAVKKYGIVDILPAPKKTRTPEEQAAMVAKMAALRERKKVIEKLREGLIMQNEERKMRKAAADALANEDAFYTEKDALYAGEQKKKKPSKKQRAKNRARKEAAAAAAQS